MKHSDSVDESNSGTKLTERRLTILTIDDVEQVVSCIEDFLTAHGYIVFTALSGERGLEILQKARVDVVLCDLHMPGMNGWEVCKAIQKVFRKDVEQTPVFILVTGSAGHAYEESRSIESGVAAIVEKPVDLTRLLVIINGATGNPGKA